MKPDACNTTDSVPPPDVKLTVSSAKVREAAAKCGDAANVLKVLFPEAFPPPPSQEVIIEDRGSELDYRDHALPNNGGALLAVRRFGNYAQKSFYLNDTRYTWEVKKDNTGQTVLVPTRKVPK